VHEALASIWPIAWETLDIFWLMHFGTVAATIVERLTFVDIRIAFLLEHKSTVIETSLPFVLRYPLFRGSQNLHATE